MPEAEAPAEQRVPRMELQPRAPRLASDTTRNWISIGIASFIYVLYLLFFPWQPDPSDISSWVLTFIAVYSLVGMCDIALSLRTFAGADSATLHHWLVQTTPRRRSSRFWLLFSGGSGVSWASQGSIVAIVAVLGLAFVPELRSNPLIVIGSIAIVVVAWLSNCFAFAIQYARLNATTHGVAFPGESPPTFSDYFYLAVQVLTTFSTSDVTVTTTQLRRTVTSHSIIAFAFNTIIIALLVSAIISTAT